MHQTLRYLLLTLYYVVFQITYVQNLQYYSTQHQINVAKKEADKFYFNNIKMLIIYLFYHIIKIWIVCLYYIQTNDKLIE